METWKSVFWVGVGATALTDLWTLVRRRWMNVPLPDWGLVGRWIGHLGRGTFRHASMARAMPVAHERPLGWMAHYAIGIGFAAGLPLFVGREWFDQPRLLPALLLGLVTVAAPFLILQPGMGAGVAASRTPDPRRARLHSLATHLVFGFGLYLAALALA